MEPYSFYKFLNLTFLTSHVRTYHFSTIVVAIKIKVKVVSSQGTGCQVHANWKTILYKTLFHGFGYIINCSLLKGIPFTVKNTINVFLSYLAKEKLWHTVSINDNTKS